MHRIDTATRDQDEHGSGKDGFTGGNPQQNIAPTDLSADWCDAVQEEIANAIEERDLALAKGTHTQLSEAIARGIKTLQMANWAMKNVADVGGAGTHSEVIDIVSSGTWLLAVTDAGVIKSPNAHEWGTIGSLSSPGKYLCAGWGPGNGYFMIAADDGSIARTQLVGAIPNFFFTDVTPGTSNGRQLNDIAFANGVWVAVGADPGSGAEIYRSTDDGGSWTFVSDPSPDGNDLLGVVGDDAGTWVAVGQNGKLLYSTDDGASWSTAASGTTEDLNAVDHSSGEGRWVAGGTNGQIVQSPDPTSGWGTMSVSAKDRFFDDEIHDVRSDDGKHWIVVQNRTLHLLRYDGAGGTPKTYYITQDRATKQLGVAYDERGFFIGGQENDNSDAAVFASLKQFQT